MRHRLQSQKWANHESFRVYAPQEQNDYSMNHLLTSDSLSTSMPPPLSKINHKQLILNNSVVCAPLAPQYRIPYEFYLTWGLFPAKHHPKMLGLTHKAHCKGQVAFIRMRTHGEVAGKLTLA